MKTNIENNRKPILVKIAEQLLKDQQELDDLAVQLSLGKLEFADKFKDVKKEMKDSVAKFRQMLKAEYQHILGIGNTIDEKLNELELELAENVSETKQIFKEQTKSILKKIEDVIIETKKYPSEVSDYFNLAAEKIKLQIELLERKSEIKKIEITKEFKDEMKSANEKVNAFISKIKEKGNEVDMTMENFSAEFRLSYDHLKKAIKAL